MSSASERPGRGHYEWGNWCDAMRAVHLWVLGGPWPTMIADVKTASLVSSVSELHQLKDQLVWEIVEQTYLRAERARRSVATDDTVKTRIRSVFSWQRRHDVKKNSLMWFVNFAFTLAAYSEFQAHMLFSNSSIPNTNPASSVPDLTPSDFGRHAVRMEQEMFLHGFLPFYYAVAQLENRDTLYARHLATGFCQELVSPTVDMDGEVKETRGMPREEKAIDFMTPWLQILELPEHKERWDTLLSSLVEYSSCVSNSELFKSELCRCIVSLVLLQICVSVAPEAGYVYDITASTAVEQSERELLVSLRLPGQKRKRTVSRRTLRGDLDVRLQNFLAHSSSTTEASSSKRNPGSSSQGHRVSG